MGKRSLARAMLLSSSTLTLSRSHLNLHRSSPDSLASKFSSVIRLDDDSSSSDGSSSSSSSGSGRKAADRRTVSIKVANETRDEDGKRVPVEVSSHGPQCRASAHIASTGRS